MTGCLAANYQLASKLTHVGTQQTMPSLSVLWASQLLPLSYYHLTSPSAPIRTVAPSMRPMETAWPIKLPIPRTPPQAQGKTVSYMIAVQQHLWLTLANLPDLECVSLLDAPLTPPGLLCIGSIGQLQKLQRKSRSSVPSHEASLAPVAFLSQVGG